MKSRLCYQAAELSVELLVHITRWVWSIDNDITYTESKLLIRLRKLINDNNNSNNNSSNKVNNESVFDTHGYHGNVIYSRPTKPKSKSVPRETRHKGISSHVNRSSGDERSRPQCRSLVPIGP